jgi:hypothetical protein
MRTLYNTSMKVVQARQQAEKLLQELESAHLRALTNGVNGAPLATIDSDIVKVEAKIQATKVSVLCPFHRDLRLFRVLRLPCFPLSHFWLCHGTVSPLYFSYHCIDSATLLQSPQETLSMRPSTSHDVPCSSLYHR